jgi:signal transduction histidine kinase
MPDIIFIILPLLLVAVVVLSAAAYLYHSKVLQVTKDNEEFKDIFKAIWEIEKALLETVDFDEATKRVVNIILTQLGYINHGYEVVVLSLLDVKKGELRRIAISKTQAAEQFLKATPIPFENIVIPLAAKQNLSVKAVVERKMFTTESVSDVLYPALSKEWVEAFQKNLGIKTTIVYPILVKDKPLGTLIFSLSKEKQEITDQEWSVLDSFVGAVGVALDNAILFKSLNTATTQLQNANEKLKQVDRLKDEFVSLASHELRTPMTVIKSYLWMMSSKNNALNLTEKQRTYVDRAYLSTQRLINLVNDMLNVSRIESKRFTLSMQFIDLTELIDTIHEEMLSKAQEQKINFQFVRPLQSLPKVQADPERVEQVLINLIGNSLKFTPANGTIKVEINHNPSERIATVSVSDNGKGISKEDMGKLFQKFSMVGRNYLVKQNAQGTGLGLYLSKSIIELMGGRIWVKSEGEGKGSSFSFSLKTV